MSIEDCIARAGGWEAMPAAPDQADIEERRRSGQKCACGEPARFAFVVMRFENRLDTRWLDLCGRHAVAARLARYSPGPSRFFDL